MSHNGTSSFYRKLFALVLPITFQSLMSALVSASDALMLGMLDQSSLSAVSLGTQVGFVHSLFMAALVIGLTILGAQYWGKGDKDAVEKVLAIGLRLSILISFVFFLASFGIPELLMKIFTNEEELIALGVPYLRTVSWSFLFIGISQMYLCIMKNSGRTARSTVYASTSLILNIILNAVLIFGLFGLPGMGITGAAIATNISRIVELLLVAAENTKKEHVRIRWRYLKKTDPELTRDFFRYTTPVMCNEIVWGCGFTMFSVIMGHLGNDAVAANSIANITKNIIACVCSGIGNGSSIIVGNELGSGNLEMAKKYGNRLCHIALIAGIVSGLALLAASPLIVHFSTTLTEQARYYLRIMLYMCSYYLIGKSMNATTISGIFCAGGDTKFGMISDAVNMWLVIIPIGLIAAFVIKAPVLVVYFLLNLDEFTKLPFVYRHYKKYQWVKNLTKSDHTSQSGSPTTA